MPASCTGSLRDGERLADRLAADDGHRQPGQASAPQRQPAPNPCVRRGRKWETVGHGVKTCRRQRSSGERAQWHVAARPVGGRANGLDLEDEAGPGRTAPGAGEERDDDGRSTCRAGRQPATRIAPCRRSATGSARGRPPASAACPTARSTTPPPSPCASTTCRRSPRCPRRSPAEGMIAQAVVGINGVTLGQYGSIAVDVEAHSIPTLRCTPISPTTPSPGSGRSSPPPRARPDRSGEVAVRRAGDARRGADRVGVPVDTAFAVAVRAVRAHLAALAGRRGRRRCRSRRRSSGSTSRGSAS